MVQVRVLSLGLILKLKIMKSVFLFIVLTAFIYGLFSFFYLSIDPHGWSEGGRYLFCTMEFIILLVLVGYKLSESLNT